MFYIFVNIRKKETDIYTKENKHRQSIITHSDRTIVCPVDLFIMHYLD
jgi:hypothetical protein